MGDMKKLLFPFILATIFHVALFNLEIPKKVQGNSLSKSDPITLTTIDPNILRRLRTVGVKNGSKDFSGPLRVKNLNVASLRPKKIKPVEKGPTLRGESVSIPDSNPLTIVEGGSADSAISPQILKAFKSTNLNVAFEPPEGVDKDKLNSVEKKFYGFSRRTYDLYVSSLIRSLNNIIRERPHLNFMEIEGSYNLVGKIAFNRQGDAVSTRFLKVANHDDVQQLFENTLMDIRVIPNPPKELLKKDGTFSIYYKLRVGL